MNVSFPVEVTNWLWSFEGAMVRSCSCVCRLDMCPDQKGDVVSGPRNQKSNRVRNNNKAVVLWSNFSENVTLKWPDLWGGRPKDRTKQAEPQGRRKPARNLCCLGSSSKVQRSCGILLLGKCVTLKSPDQWGGRPTESFTKQTVPWGNLQENRKCTSTYFRSPGVYWQRCREACVSNLL